MNMYGHISYIIIRVYEYSIKYILKKPIRANISCLDAHKCLYFRVNNNNKIINISTLINMKSNSKLHE